MRVKEITIFFSESSSLFKKYNGNKRFEEVEVEITEDMIIIKESSKYPLLFPRSEVEDYEREEEDE